MTNIAEITTQRFLLRSLCEEDATERYLSWFQDHDTRRFITAAQITDKITGLRAYIKKRENRSDIAFFGIFTKTSGLHIGNIKYEPIDSSEGYAVMGILIGDPSYRGKGVTSEVLTASAAWLKSHRMIKQIILGVHVENLAAIHAYKKVGFVSAKTPYVKHTDPDYQTMVWTLH